MLLYPAAENVSSASTATSVHTIIPLVAPAARTESVSSLESGISPSQLIQQIEECKKPDTTAEISGLDRVFTEAGTLPPPIPIAISETPRSHSPSTILGISKAPNLASSSGDEQSIATSIIGSKVGGPVILADEEMAVVRRNENLIDLEEGLSASAVAAAAASFVLESFKPSDSNEIKLMDSRLYQRKDSTGSLYLNTTPPNLGASPSSNTLSPRAYSETYSNFKAATSYNTLTGDSTGNIAGISTKICYHLDT